MNSPALYLEISQSSFRALHGEDGFECPLEREENGCLKADCAEKLTQGLRLFLKEHRWHPRLPVFCAVGARGVSLRRLTLPSSSKEELQRLLPLQIERELPVPPDELAWGWRQLSPGPSAGNGAPAAQELLVAAVRKEVLQGYSDILSECGLKPQFTLAALARSSLCSDPPRSYAVLDIGRSHSELISFNNGAPASIRLLPWGEEDLKQAAEKELALNCTTGEKVALRSEPPTGSSVERRQPAQAAFLAELQAFDPKWIGRKLYLTGATAALAGFVPLVKALGGNVECEQINAAPGPGRSAAILGLRKECEGNAGATVLILQPPASRSAASIVRPNGWKWAALAVLLVVSSLTLRYAEVFLNQRRLTRRLSEIKAYRETLPNLERDLSFLQYLKTNQPAYLDALGALANAAPGGIRFETLSMNRRGDLALRTAMRDAQQVADFRSKLIDSGLFSTVVVEEQTPTPDRQKITVRIVGQWKRADGK